MVLQNIFVFKRDGGWMNSTPDLFFLNHGFVSLFVIKLRFPNTIVPQSYNIQTGPQVLEIPWFSKIFVPFETKDR